ncbi:MAG: hypothetical protein MO846_00875 [Candidatus Devosia symbiotica]|nr:hypothetical protein [Candidatus Devosia symbiotica]
MLARHDQPPFAASVMDSYAARSVDIVERHGLHVIGTTQAGAGFAGTVAAGEAVWIFTGAPVPAGADAVIMQEGVRLADGLIRFS